MFTGMALTDLDGTFLDSRGKISCENLATLHLLGEKKIARVAATGRNINSSREVLSHDLPFDFLIFSTGAGVCNFADDKVIHHNELSTADIHAVGEFFQQRDLDFSIHHPIPDNHCFYLFPSSNPTIELLSRLKYLHQFSSTSELHAINRATQILAIALNGIEIIDQLQNAFSHLNIIRTTSPIDGKHVWIEVFPGGVSKGQAANWLCQKLNISQQSTMSIGNDYNDVAMLEWTNHSFIVENAPADLKSRFLSAPGNDANGFAVAVNNWLRHLKP